jgi:hypothetical protein
MEKMAALGTERPPVAIAIAGDVHDKLGDRMNG